MSSLIENLRPSALVLSADIVPAIQRSSRLNCYNLHDHQMDTYVLSNKELGDSTIARGYRQTVSLSEPERPLLTTLVRGVEQPLASSNHSIIESTLVTENQHEMSENGWARSHDGKNTTERRGRPRVNIIGSTRAEVSIFSITEAACRADIDYK
jgi:hypothetical protein